MRVKLPRNTHTESFRAGFTDSQGQRNNLMPKSDRTYESTNN